MRCCSLNIRGRGDPKGILKSRPGEVWQGVCVEPLAGKVFPCEGPRQGRNPTDLPETPVKGPEVWHWPVPAYRSPWDPASYLWGTPLGLHIPVCEFTCFPPIPQEPPKNRDRVLRRAWHAGERQAVPICSACIYKLVPTDHQRQLGECMSMCVIGSCKCRIKPSLTFLL